MEPYGERIMRAAVNVLHTRGQDGRDWLSRALLVATGKLDHTCLDAGSSADTSVHGQTRSPAARRALQPTPVTRPQGRRS